MASGPNSYDLLSASLAACTAMTIRLHARHKNYPLSHVEVAVSYHHADDNSRGSFQRVITLRGSLDNNQRAQLLRGADSCPAGMCSQRQECRRRPRRRIPSSSASPKNGKRRAPAIFSRPPIQGRLLRRPYREHRWSSAGGWIGLGFGSLAWNGGQRDRDPGILVTEVDVKHQAVRARNPRPSQEFRRRRGGLGLPARVTDQRFAHRPSSSTMNTIGLGCSIADGFVPRSGECGCSLMSIS